LAHVSKIRDKLISMDNPIFIIRFGHSKSPNYQEIMKRCQKFENFTEGHENTNILLIYDFKEVIKYSYHFSEIIRVASGWKSFFMMYRDHEVKSSQNYATHVRNIASCANGRMKSEDPDYCTAKKGICNWGCKFLSDIGKEPSDYAMKWWYEFGHFTPAPSYEIDKDKLMNALKTEAYDKLIDNCPYYAEMNLTKQVFAIPDEIDITDSVNWCVELKHVFIGQKQVMIPVGIRHRELFQRPAYGLSLGVFNLDEKPYINKTDQKVNPNLTDEDANALIEYYLKNKNNASKANDTGSSLG
jgi:hypothetical protein